MSIHKVAVFNASSRMGQAQVKELLKQNYEVRAVTRTPSVFTAPTFKKIEIVAADYADTESLHRACADIDAVFFQPPSIEDPRHCVNLAEAAAQASIKKFVYNTTMWAPDHPCGEPGYDAILSMENFFVGKKLPIVIFRPVLFMDNLLTKFAKPALVEEGVYRYCHKPGMLATWISMDDVAKFMIEGLKRDALLGERITIGGPETLPLEKVLAILSDAIGKPIAHEFVPPREFASTIFSIVKDNTFLDEAAYQGFFESFYTFNNYSEYKPFECDMSDVLTRIPVDLTPFAEWAASQDWQSRDYTDSGSSAG